MKQPHTLSRRCRGLSMIELMVGITIGLFVMVGLSKMMVDHLLNNRTLLIETRVNQDLRAAADFIARDLRRDGYWQNAQKGVWYKGGATAPTINPYAASASAPSATSAAYAYNKDADDALATSEQFGVELNAGALRYKVGNAWQQITDPNTTTITAFNVALTSQTAIDLTTFCVPALCSSTLGCPQQLVRSFAITITAQAAGNSAVTRSIRENVRIRNDRITGACST